MDTGLSNMPGAGKNSSFTIKDYFFKYLAYWPLFLITLCVCVATGFLYTRYATPIYKANTMILVKSDQATGGGPRTSEDLIRNALEGGARPNNLDNEIQLLTSTDLMERVTAKNDFNISYYKQANIRKVDLYTDVPFRLKLMLDSDTADDRPVTIIISNLSDAGGTLAFDGEKTRDVSKFNWNETFMIGWKKFVLTHQAPVAHLQDSYSITWTPVKQAAAEIESKYTVDVLDKKSSIITLEVLSKNLKRGQDILNAVYREFNLTDLQEKNAASEKTTNFINERLAIVTNELDGVEGSLENYQGNNRIINVASQSSQSFDNANDVSKNLTTVNVQQGVVKMIEEYFNKDDNEGKLVPSSLGINDATLASLIARYNELQLKKERDAPSLAPNGVILKDLNNQISNIRGSILENLQNISKNLHLQETSLQQKNSQYNEFLSALPHKERMMQEIKRKQSITEGLYLYLLQKREETSISASSSNVSIYKQIDQAKGFGPVQPNVTNIRLYSIVFGLLIPIGIIRVRDMLNDKIVGKNDITSNTPVPVIAELSHLAGIKNPGIVVKSRDLIAEQFRQLRTNLSFISAGPEMQVIMITSSATNEGKSFVSLNLAAVLAAPGNKVALLEFDMRLPSLSGIAALPPSSIGISDYLNGTTADLNAICHDIEGVPGLHFYAAGSAPENAADLLMSPKLPVLIDLLKSKYQYIIIDTAPAALVTDAFILGKFCNTVMYVIRQNHTDKKQLDFINDISRLEKFSNLCIVFNDIKSGGKYGSAYYNQTAYNNIYGTNKKRGIANRLRRA